MDTTVRQRCSNRLYTLQEKKIKEIIINKTNQSGTAYGYWIRLLNSGAKRFTEFVALRIGCSEDTDTWSTHVPGADVKMYNF
jgi:hypothetical protein